MSLTVRCTLDEVSPSVTQFVEESIQKFQKKAESLKQRDYYSTACHQKFRLTTDEKFSFTVTISIDCNDNKQYDINTLAGKVTFWTPEFLSDAFGRGNNIPSDRVIALLELTQAVTEIYAPIFKQKELSISKEKW